MASRNGVCFQDLDGYLQEYDRIQQSDDEVKMAMAMAGLKHRFCYLLSSYSTTPGIYSDSADESSFYTDSSSSSTPVHYRFSISSDTPETNDLDLDDIDLPVVCYLRSIAERMIAAGFTQDCVESYGKIRRQAMDAILVELEMEDASTRHIQMLEQHVQARKIRQWIKAARVLIRTIFANEKLIIHHIFSGLKGAESVDVLCFALTVKTPALQLLNFADTVSRVIPQSAPERLFALLDLHEALHELLPEIKTMFGVGEYLGLLHEQAVLMLSKVAAAARGMLEDFEKSLMMSESGCQVTQTGDVLPLTRYVMDFLKRMAVYGQPLTKLIDFNPQISMEFELKLHCLNIDFVKSDGMPPLPLHLHWIIAILLFRLEEKSRLCHSTSLAHFFLMNNIHYMAWNIESCSKLKAVIEDHEHPECLHKLTVQFRKSALEYERATWSSALRCLKAPGDRMTKGALRTQFKNFNTLFLKTCKAQAKWLVPDADLRQELQLSVSFKLILGYRTFLKRFFSSEDSSKYIKYTAEEIEDVVLDLFEGDLPKGLLSGHVYI